MIIATVMRDVLRALEYIHRQGGIHRDVKVWGQEAGQGGMLTKWAHGR